MVRNPVIYVPNIKAPLHRACELNNCDEMLEYLKDFNGNLNLRDIDRYTALHYACKYERVLEVHSLIEQPRIQLDDVQNRQNITPLHLAALFNKTHEIIRLLIEAGCDVNIKDRFDHTALHYIILNSSDFRVKVEMCRLLLENGFDLTKIDNFYLLQLILQEVGEVKYIEHDEKCEGFKNYLNFISMFLYYNIDVNFRGRIDDYYDHANKAFGIVLSNGIHAVIDLFMDYIDDFNYGFWENSYLMLAVECEYPRISEMVDKGADINFMNFRGRSCLHKSLECKNNQLFKYFWQNCNLDLILERSEDFLDEVLNCTNRYSPKNFLETIYIILESKYALQLLEYSTKNRIYTKLVKRFFKTGYSLKDILKIFYTILSIINEVSSKDLLYIYKSYDFNEEFEAFLIVNARVFEDLPLNHDSGICVDRFLHIINPRLKMNYTHFPLTLMELSRDAFRANIKKKLFDSKSTCFDFYTKIQSMKIPKIIKDILVLKNPSLTDLFIEVITATLHRRRAERALMG